MQQQQKEAQNNSDESDPLVPPPPKRGHFEYTFWSAPSQMDTEVKKSPIAENLRRTRSGRVIRSTTVSLLHGEDL